MTLRCKDGDIAVITWDYPDCRENIGRLVDVRGPMRVNEAGPSWLIRPITPELYALHESNHALCREQVTWASDITHPDAWMMPVRPQQEADGVQTGETCSAPALATPLVETAPWTVQTPPCAFTPAGTLTPSRLSSPDWTV